jgi:hypothetical protein
MGRSSRTSARLKLAEVAPIPRASEQTATQVKPGFLPNIRRAWRNEVNISIYLGNCFTVYRY